MERERDERSSLRKAIRSEKTEVRFTNEKIFSDNDRMDIGHLTPTLNQERTKFWVCPQRECHM